MKNLTPFGQKLVAGLITVITVVSLILTNDIYNF
jgi:hypothetical protein